MNDNHEALTFHTEPVKATNPKDAIGDTKVPLWLLSTVAKVHWAMGQFAGMIKYGAWNWRAAGVRTSVYLSAMERHIEAYKSGEEFDPTDGTHHLGNVMACCAILLDAQAAGKLTDDRPPVVGHRQTLSWAESLMARLKDQYKDKNPRHYTIADTADTADPAPAPPPTPRPVIRTATVTHGKDLDKFRATAEQDRLEQVRRGIADQTGWVPGPPQGSVQTWLHGREAG